MRVAVAMSGGVDSSTAAAILQEQGYEVIGLTMHLWDPTEDGGKFGRCCSPDDIQDARRVADQLGIAHYVINLRAAFEREVVEHFVEEYLIGRTPNPCIRCNDRLKFGPLLRRAGEAGASFLATGHYARIARDPVRQLNRLLRGKDRGKDQSYFLFTLNQEQMNRVVFPLGEMTKGEVRRKAQALGLRVARKAESQEICFVPGDNYREFVQARKGEISFPGEVVNRNGEVLGRHRGIYAYTIGQRRGLGIAAPRPLYVQELDAERNRVVVGPQEDLLRPGLVAERVNWIVPPPVGEKLEAEVQIRYRHSGAAAVLSSWDGGKVQVKFHTPQRSVTPGQAVVFYRGEEVLGGGWIAKVP